MTVPTVGGERWEPALRTRDHPRGRARRRRPIARRVCERRSGARRSHGNARSGYVRAMTNDESAATRPMQAAPGLRANVERLEGSEALDRAANRLQPAAQAIGEGRFGEPLRGTWLGHALHPLLTDVP